MKTFFFLLIAHCSLLIACSNPDPKTRATEAVSEYIKTNLGDPASYEAGQWWVQEKYVDSVGGTLRAWEIKHRFRGKNSFGALVQDEAVFMVDTLYHVEPFNDPYFGQ